MAERLASSLCLLRISLLTSMLLLYSNVASAQLWLVTHSTNQAQLSPQQARSIFSLRQSSWSNGEPIRIVVANPSSELHQQFCLEVMKVFPYQLERIWNRKVYTGNAFAPVIVENNQELIDYITRHPEAIGYIDEEVSNEEVRLLDVN